ncbi:MAG: GTPase domain-containing protein [candidate division Zixibacteria bacterium]
MKLGKIFKFFKKGAKAAGGAKGKKGETPSHWPSGTRIGIYGHSNSGKTVYFTVLNEECKISKRLQISVTDNITAGEFLSNYRSLWGLGTAADAGTVVDFQSEKKFPDPTPSDKLLQFNAILDRSKKISIVAYDYGGRAIAITGQNDLADKVIDYMTGCDGILFFYDPKIMGAELESQAHVASFINILEKLAPLKSRLPIPIGIVITKSDILPGFSGEDQVSLIKAEDEYLASEDFESFLEKILADPRINSNASWAGSVRNILIRLKDFFRVVLERTLDFQIFFISATGQTPEKIGADIGRSIYAPPERIRPIGVKEPFYWLLNSIVRSKRISKVRSLAKLVATISIIWCVVFSIPFLYHHNFLLPRTERVEENIISAYDGKIFNTTDRERRRIIQAYDKYERSWAVKWFFDKYQAPSQRIREAYRRFNQQEAIQLLNGHISRMAAVVADTNLWPRLNPSDQSLILAPEHNSLLESLQSYHQGDESSILYKRSGRALVYWDLFAQGVTNPNDTAVWQTIQQQVQTDRGLYGQELSKEEMALGDVLSERKIKKVQKVAAKKAAVELGDLIDKVNGNDSPSYRLDRAVAELRTIKSQLDSEADKANLKMINNYISDAKKWWNPRTYTYKVESIPGDGHLHVEVTSRGKDPAWAEQTQVLSGFEYKLTWKKGDVIHIALDTLGAAEMWGRDASDKKILKSDFSIFDMDGEISFDNIGKKIIITFNPGLKGRMPELK